jgi:hypothetical protein
MLIDPATSSVAPALARARRDGLPGDAITRRSLYSFTDEDTSSGGRSGGDRVEARARALGPAACDRPAGAEHRGDG